MANVCDASVIGVNDSTPMEDLKRASLFHLAFWSHPAWSALADCPLSARATTYWIMHHRMSAATDKKTISELVGSVKGVIPRSKLAQYGDYSYNFDHEDMFQEVANINRVFDATKHSPTKSREVPQTEEEDKILQTKRWMDKVEEVLRLVMCVANESCSGDSESRATLKLCLRIIYAANNNDSLIHVLNSEGPVFVTYCDEVLKMPSSRIELFSLPQPENESDRCLDYGKIDALWIKLSSTEIQKLWDAEEKIHSDPEIRDNALLLPLMKINFLRRHRESRTRNREFMERIANVPKDVGIELLGSLLEFMEEASQIIVPLEPTDDTQRNCFPEAHGTWTQQLFPLRMQPNCKLAVLPRSVINPQTKNRQNDDSTVKAENMQMPLQFYMSVPPPNLASTIRPPPFQVHRHANPLLLPNNESAPKCLQVAQQVQFKVPAVARMCSIPYSTQPQSWNMQRFQVPLQQGGSATMIPGLNLPRMVYQDNYPTGLAVQNHFLKPDDACFNPEYGSKQYEELLKNKHAAIEKAEIVKRRPFSQFTVYNESNLANKVGNYECVNQRGFYKNSIQMTSADTRNVNQIASLQVKESRLASHVNHFVPNGRLPPSNILQQSMAPWNHRVEQLPRKPRYFGSFALNEWKHSFQRFCHQRQSEFKSQLLRKGIPVENPSVILLNCTSFSCEDKVKIWLETVNMYMKDGSCCYSEELSETCLLETTSHSGVASVQREDLLSTVKQFPQLQGPSLREVNIKTLLRLCKVGRNVQDLTKGGKNSKKKKIAKLLSKYLQPFENRIARLKKGYNLESKVKQVKTYLANIDAKKNANGKWNLKRKIGNYRKRSRESDISLCHQESKHPVIEANIGLGKEHQKQKDVDGLLSKFLLDDNIDFKIFVRENKRFNTFPSKRTKISSRRQFFNNETWSESDPLADLNYFDSMIDDLFFPTNNETERKPKTPDDFAMSGGWTHFQLTVKSVLKNIVSSSRKFHSSGKENLFLNV